MVSELKVYNSLSRKKENFVPQKEGKVGMYVCGPTVYSEVHLGNVRSFVSFDIIYRFLQHIGFKVRYVRNITDVGHLEGDIDIGAEDKISKKARLEQLEPMEIVETYTRSFHQVMKSFNALPPNIEPRATAHIIEQIEMVKKILDQGFGYIVNGSVYFNTQKVLDAYGEYGKLSGRKLEDLIAESRDNLKHQDEKKHPSDFAIWIKADPNHIMRWPSPWSDGFPGWHLECSVMSTKYLGKTFDIHGGGSDLKFPHHENEVAQNYGACGCGPAKYWLHGNMLLMNGRKMSKSDGNTISPEQLFTGKSPHVSKGYSPMVVRFFMLQSHYRSTLDISDIALAAAEKGFLRLMEATTYLLGVNPSNLKGGELDTQINNVLDKCMNNMLDDFNTPMALANLFDLVTVINKLKDGHFSFSELSGSTLERLKKDFENIIFDVFGLKNELISSDDKTMDSLMELIIDIRQKSRAEKDWATADKIRDVLQENNLVLKDGTDGTSWVKN